MSTASTFVWQEIRISGVSPPVGSTLPAIIILKALKYVNSSIISIKEKN
jgi:hypothetical protein